MNTGENDYSIEYSDIGIFVGTNKEVSKVKRLLQDCDLPCVVITRDVSPEEEGVRIGTHF